MTIADVLYWKLIKRDPTAEEQFPEEVHKDIPSNGMKQVSALALQSTSDQLVNASTILPWLFAVLGVPAAFTGFLVPIRESGSMLPQAALTPIVMRTSHRKWVFSAGALVQAGSVAAMAFTAATGSGTSAGIGILIALAVFSLGRCLCSIASKDVLGKTIPKGQRGQINGWSTTASGLVAVTVGLAIRFFGGEDMGTTAIAWLFVIAALLWCGVAVVFARVREPESDPSEPTTQSGPESTSQGWLRRSLDLLRQDKPFRHFVGVRSLLLVSSLSPAFLVTYSIQMGSGGLAGLGGFVMAAGGAKLIGGPLFGRFADRSSKNLMSAGAGLASTIIILTVLATFIPAVRESPTLINVVFVIAYFAISLLHTGVRIGRKTYIVDMAEGDQRTQYTAVSNSAMGVVLLVVGAMSSALAAIDVMWALLFLAAMGLVGVVAGGRLPDVSLGE